MGDSLVAVVSIVVVLAGIVAIFTLVTSRRAWSDVGSGGLEGAGDAQPSEPLVDARDQEIHQMLGARNARRERRGEQPLDLDEELAMLLRPTAGDDVRDEVRAMVEARNRRLERSGMQPLDVDAEIERQLRELN